jgi:hypothetical protein
LENNKISSVVNTKEKAVEKDILESEIKEPVMERVINHSEVMPSTQIETEKSENNVELSSNNNNNSVCIKNTEIETTSEALKEVRDGYYFLRLLFTEKARILKLADDAEKELEVLQSDVSCCCAKKVPFMKLNSKLIAISALHGSSRRNCRSNSCGDWQVTSTGNKEVQTV